MFARSLWIAVFWLAACFSKSRAQQPALKDLGLEWFLGGPQKPLKLGQSVYTDAAKRPISITRCDFLVSQFALRREDGSWLETKDWSACIKPTENRTRSRVEGVPVQKYTAIRFQIGVDDLIDKGDPNQFPPHHPLHPQVNGLHWGWQSGYVYLALEGHWQKADGKSAGFSYHLAGAPQRMTIELPVNLDLQTCGTLQIGFDPAAALAKIDIAKLGDSTHSREQDGRADAIRLAVVPTISIIGQLPELLQTPASPAMTTGPVIGTPHALPISQRLPQVLLPADNPLTLEGIALGKRLFHEKKLSKNLQQSCATCHERSFAFTDHGKKLSKGVTGATGTFNSMPLFNLLWQSEFFWDGRAKSLREQVLEPIEAAHEMNSPLPEVVKKLTADASYRSQFQLAFGSEEITPQRLGLALEQFLSTLISQDSKFDQALRKEAQLTAQEQRGLQLFLTEYDPKRNLFGADCFHCHGGALFTNSGFANNGLDKNPLAPGRSAATKNPADEGKFRVPSLRNIARTAPYMHDGRFKTLEEVIRHYNQGVKPSTTLDPNLAKHPPEGLGLSEADQAALVAFLQTLTDESFVNPKQP
jgi:cytochrome c peroxidase